MQPKPIPVISEALPKTMSCEEERLQIMTYMRWNENILFCSNQPFFRLADHLAGASVLPNIIIRDSDRPCDQRKI